jgi:hypothetical protein
MSEELLEVSLLIRGQPRAPASFCEHISYAVILFDIIVHLQVTVLALIGILLGQYSLKLEASV